MKPDFAPESGSRVRLGQTTDFRIGGMRVSPARRQVQVDGETQTLEPRVMQVLVALAAARPGVVARDRLAEACWGGVAVGDDAINRCIVSLRKLSRAFTPPPFTIETVPRVGYSLREAETIDEPAAETIVRAETPRPKWLVPAMAVAGLALMTAALAWHPWRSNPVSVAITAATSDSNSQALARDLTAKLAMISEVSDRTRLFTSTNRAAADLTFEIDASAPGSRANLTLLNDRHETLWSKDFGAEGVNPSQLEAQLASSAGKVLQCDLETRTQGKTGLKPDTIKTYLNGCAGFADANENTLRDLANAFQRVTRAAPNFQPAWSKLLLSEALILDTYDVTAASRADAQQVMAAAQRAAPSLPQLNLLRSALLRPTDYADRLRLVEEASRRADDDSDTLEVYSRILARVGRLGSSIAVARRAVQLDPLSPGLRETLIVALATAGRLAEAKEELRQAELLWPGAATLNEARYTLNLRFDDPRTAIALIDSGRLMPSSAPYQRVFLEARANRTPENVERALSDARAKYASNWGWISHTAQTFGEFGHDDELFDILLRWSHPEGVDYVTDVIFRPPLHNFRRDPRFMRVSQRLGLLEYWQRSGVWPDFCFDADMPYDCKGEAAKIAKR